MAISPSSSHSFLESQLDRWRGTPPPPVRAFGREMHDMLASIHHDPFDPGLTVGALKRRCRIRDNNVSSRFRYAVGRTIRDYIEDLRMRAACRLLVETSTSVFDIALAVGYSHPQTFYAAFRRRFGHTPAAYRDHFRAGTPGVAAEGEVMESRWEPTA